MRADEALNFGPAGERPPAAIRRSITHRDNGARDNAWAQGTLYLEALRAGRTLRANPKVRLVREWGEP